MTILHDITIQYFDGKNWHYTNSKELSKTKMLNLVNKFTRLYDRVYLTITKIESNA